MNNFYIINKNKTIHIKNNNKSCTKKYLFKLSKFVDHNINDYKLCKNCYILFISKILINNIIYYKYNNILYENKFLNKFFSNIDENGNIFINNNYINYISINKIKYYLVNNKDIFNINNFNIFNININLKIGKLLGPKMCIINKNMIIINNNNKLKYNLWEKIL